MASDGWLPRGTTAQQKQRCALTTAVLIAGGRRPEDVGWWRNDDLWHHAFVYIRAAGSAQHVDVAPFATCSAEHCGAG